MQTNLSKRRWRLYRLSLISENPVTNGGENIRNKGTLESSGEDRGNG
jgi:hypothetical protein